MAEMKTKPTNESVKDFLNVHVEPVTFRQHLVEIMLAEDRAQCRLG